MLYCIVDVLVVYKNCLNWRRQLSNSITGRCKWISALSNCKNTESSLIELEGSVIELERSVIELEISLIEFESSAIQLERSLIYLRISYIQELSNAIGEISYSISNISYLIGQLFFTQNTFWLNTLQHNTYRICIKAL